MITTEIPRHVAWGPLVPVVVAQIRARLLDTRVERLLTLPDPNTGVVVLLVGLVGSVRVSDLGLEVVLLVLDKVSDTGEVGPLTASAHVHLGGYTED
jgi:hypothetical protein